MTMVAWSMVVHVQERCVCGVSRRRSGNGSGCMPAVDEAMTSLYAARNFSISVCVPTVTRTYVGQDGHTRPTYTFFCCMAASTSLPCRPVSSMKQLLCDGVNL